ncbi:MAG: hypothetical protein K0R05_4162 [Anaerocolumna sp.]|jgi:hypothetical protein|nr:hypothetical protein [Anaerocolumna sp.]
MTPQIITYLVRLITSGYFDIKEIHPRESFIKYSFNYYK